MKVRINTLKKIGEQLGKLQSLDDERSAARGEKILELTRNLEQAWLAMMTMEQNFVEYRHGEINENEFQDSIRNQQIKFDVCKDKINRCLRYLNDVLVDTNVETKPHKFEKDWIIKVGQHAGDILGMMENELVNLSNARHEHRNRNIF
jgi:hypothetical protein